MKSREQSPRWMGLAAGSFRTLRMPHWTPRTAALASQSVSSSICAHADSTAAESHLSVIAAPWAILTLRKYLLVPRKANVGRGHSHDPSGH